MSGWNHTNADWRDKICKACGEAFKPRSGSHTFCTPRCKRKIYAARNNSAHQYARISGDWRKYFTRLCTQKARKGVISADDCLRILEQQNGLCALSGEKLTCVLSVGTKTPTNASIDRIDPKGGYEPQNVQLVCAAINYFRLNTSIDDFVSWCRKVADFAVQEPER